MAAPTSKPSPKASDGETKPVDNPQTQSADSMKAAPEPVNETLSSQPLANAKSPPEGSPPTYESSEKSSFYQAAKSLLQSGDFETALTTIEEGIVATKQQLGEDESNLLHEAMAPLHYLYGTTLLYSIEESNDQQMTTTTATTNPEEGAEEAGSDDVEDTEIAWENLETARTIMERLVKERDNDDKLKADLAQVHLRLGDLQQINGKYDEAIADYNACLSYSTNNPLIPMYSRKIADIHCNLGVVYLTQVASMPADTPPETRENARQKGFYHYYECGKVFCGIIAELCNTDREMVLTKADKYLSEFKSTGDEGANIENNNGKIIAIKLQMLRNCVTELEIPNGVKDEVENFLSLLQEIQETVEEAENGEKGVQETAAMKEAISATVAAQVENEEGKDEKETATTTTTGFGSKDAITATEVAKPITTMMVKKKKKRTADELGEEEKPPAKKTVVEKQVTSE